MMEAIGICMVDPRWWNTMYDEVINEPICCKVRYFLVIKGLDGESITQTFDKGLVGISFIPSVDGLAVVARECHQAFIYLHEVRTEGYWVRTQGISKCAPMVHLQCNIHSNSIATTKPSMVHCVLGNNINVKQLFTHIGCQPSTLGMISGITSKHIFILADRKVLP